MHRNGATNSLCEISAWLSRKKVPHSEVPEMQQRGSPPARQPPSRERRAARAARAARERENADTAPRSTGENAESSATDLAGALPGLVRLVCRQAVFVPAAASAYVGTNVCLILSTTVILFITESMMMGILRRFVLGSKHM